MHPLKKMVEYFNTCVEEKERWKNFQISKNYL